MEDNQSNLGAEYRPRWLSHILRQMAKQSSVVVLIGPRQVGKSTLLQNEQPFSSQEIITLDDIMIREQAAKAPQSLWEGKSELIIDEVQREPAILSAIKLAVDRRSARFVLTGSANLLLMHKVSESLAGRAQYLNLEPMTLGEQRRQPQPDILNQLFNGFVPTGDTEMIAEDPAPLIIRGFLPGLLALNDEDSVPSYWEGYVATYLERDLRQLSQVELLPDFRRLMEALALRSGQVANQAEIARDIGMNGATVSRHIGLLETSNLIYRIPAFFGNRTSRLIKSPKIFWFDPGLAAFLSGHYELSSLRESREIGALFENVVHLHLRVLAQLMSPKARIYYWRTTAGKEVDFVLEHGRRIIPIEVKLTGKPSYGDTAGLRFFMDKHSQARLGVLIHTGSSIQYLAENIVAIPWTCFAGTAEPIEWRAV